MDESPKASGGCEHPRKLLFPKLDAGLAGFVSSVPSHPEPPA